MSGASLSTRLLRIRHENADVRRRGRNILIISLGMTALALVSLVILLVAAPSPPTLVATVGSLVMYVGIAALARQGNVTLASWLFTFAPLAATFGTGVSGDSANVMAPFYFLATLLIASATHRPRDLALTLLATLGVLAGAIWLNAAKPITTTTYEVASLNAAGLTLLAGLVGLVNATSLQGAVSAAQQAREQSEAAAKQLALVNSGLEARVRERTEALEAALAVQQGQAATLEQALADQRLLNETIVELAMPIIPMRDDTLVLPLIGALDAARLEQLHVRLLEALGRRRTHVVMVDVTGVPLIDTQVAHGLVQLALAARLMGTRMVLVGIRPEVAQALVGLGVSMQGFTTAATLQQGLEQYASR